LRGHCLAFQNVVAPARSPICNGTNQAAQVQTADQQHVGIAELYPCTMLEASRRKAIARISVSEKSAG